MAVDVGPPDLASIIGPMQGMQAINRSQALLPGELTQQSISNRQSGLNLQKDIDTYAASVAGIKAVSSSQQTAAQIAEATKYAKIQQELTAARQKQLDLSNNYNQLGSTVVGGGYNDASFQPIDLSDPLKNQKLDARSATIDQMRTQMQELGLPPSLIEAKLHPLTDGALNDPTGRKAKNYMLTLAQQMNNATQMGENMIPASVQNKPTTNAAGQIVNVSQPVGGGAPSLSPIGTSQSGQTQQGTEAPSLNPSSNQVAQTADWGKTIEGVRSAALSAKNEEYGYKQIKTLLKSGNTNTGPVAAKLNQITGGIFGDNFQEIGKYLEKSAVDKMSAMGGSGSDARLEAALTANGNNSGYNPKPLLEITNYNDAVNSALRKYSQAIDKAVGNGPNQNPGALTAVRSAWGQNLDINVFRLENAIRDGDKDELNKLKTELSKRTVYDPTMKKNVDGFTELMIKRKNLESLADQGHL